MKWMGYKRLRKADFHLAMAEVMLKALCTDDAENTTYDATPEQGIRIVAALEDTERAMENIALLYVGGNDENKLQA